MDQLPQCEKAVRDAVNGLQLQTPRLRIQKFSLCDVEANIAQETDTQLMRYIRDPHSLEKTRQNNLRMARDWNGQEGQWALFSLHGKQDSQQPDYLGLVCLRYESISNDTIEIGWRLAATHHGRGLGTEAAQALVQFIAERLKPHKVVAYCVAENTASAKIMEKLGMQPEGLLREADKIGGQWHDVAVYGRLMSS